MEYTLTAEAKKYIEGCKDELLQLIMQLCRIPAPSNDEKLRADFCLDWFKKAGAKDVYIDEALNCVCRVGCTEANDVIMFMAHTDTVFPDLEPFEPVLDGDKLCCPGVGDDTTNLAMLMLCARYFIRQGLAPDCGVLFVANAGEEGLGNLKGCRRLMEEYGHRTKMVVSFDGGLGYVCNGAVGSDRYRVKLTAQGGHSYGRFGNTNAIHLLSCMIAELYSIVPPVIDGSKTTFNVGLISGGTSVNSIAQTAEMLYEYRSDNRQCLAFMEGEFNRILEKHRAAAEDIEVEVLGRRPCMGDVDKAAQAAVEERIFSVIQGVLGHQPKTGPGSTDCNIPYSMGIPGFSTGGYHGDGAHRREEWVDITSFPKGLEVIMTFIHSYFK